MARLIQKKTFLIVCDKTNNTLATIVPTIKISGILRGIKIKAPAVVDSAATTAVVIADSDGDTIYSKSAIAAAAVNQEYQDTNHVPTQLPLADTYTITPTISATQSVPRSITVTLFIENFI